MTLPALSKYLHLYLSVLKPCLRVVVVMARQDLGSKQLENNPSEARRRLTSCLHARQSFFS